MNPEKRDRLAEEFVEKALARYSENEPRPGLEARVLARLADAHPVAKTGRQGWGTQWLGWRWAAAAAAAVLVVGIGIRMLRPAQVQAPTTAASSVSPVVNPPLSQTAPQIASSAIPKKASPQRAQRTQRTTATVTRNSHVATRGAPRLAQFPTPAPLSEQERLLLSYLQRTPKEEVLAVVKQNEQFEQQLRAAEEARTYNDEEEK